MNPRGYSQPLVHLLKSSDLLSDDDDATAAAHLVYPDGRRVAVSSAVLEAVQQVLHCAKVDYSVQVRPVWKVIGVGDVGVLFPFLSADYVMQLIEKGALQAQHDDLGPTVLLEDVIALDEKQRVVRERALDELANDEFVDLEYDSPGP